jgi:hypothetical protein
MSVNRSIVQDHDYCLHHVCGGMHKYLDCGNLVEQCLVALVMYL